MGFSLGFKEHMAHALAKGTKWVTAKMARGMKGEFMRAMLYGVALPSMLYAVDMWCVPPVRRVSRRQTRGMKGFIGKMERVQSRQQFKSQEHYGQHQQTCYLHMPTSHQLNTTCARSAIVWHCRLQHYLKRTRLASS